MTSAEKRILRNLIAAGWSLEKLVILLRHYGASYEMSEAEDFDYTSALRTLQIAAEYLDAVES